MSDCAENEPAPEGASAWVARLHELVDEAAEPVRRSHESRMKCRAGCSGCCSDDLTVFAIEAALITGRNEALLRDGTPHPEGACAFLDAAGACRIYEERPYVCRTQGLPLRWLAEDEESGDIIEGRDVCPLNLEGVALEELPSDQLWTLGPFEQRLADRQHGLDGGEGRRVKLRDLFQAKGTSGALDARRHLPILAPEE